jgi:hypothetical protein
MKQFIFSLIAALFGISLIVPVIIPILFPESQGAQVHAGKLFDEQTLVEHGFANADAAQRQLIQILLVCEGEAELYRLVADEKEVERLAQKLKITKEEVVKAGLTVMSHLKKARQTILLSQLFGPIKYLAYNAKSLKSLYTDLLAKRSGYYMSFDTEKEWLDIKEKLDKSANINEFMDSHGFGHFSQISFKDLFTMHCSRNECTKEKQCFECVINPEISYDSLNKSHDIEFIAAVMIATAVKGEFIHYVNEAGHCTVVYITNIEDPNAHEVDKLYENANKLLRQKVLEMIEILICNYRHIKQVQDAYSL